MATKAKPKADPFKTHKSKDLEPKANDTLSPPEEVATAIDSFREAQEQAKHFDGEAQVQKEAVLRFAQAEYAKRALSGTESSFKIVGHEAMVTFVATDSSAGLTDDDVAQISERWGEAAADELVVRDFGSIRFDADVLEANYDKVVEALQALPEDVVERLFKPMLLKARAGIVERARKYAKTPEELQELMRALKIKNYIK